MRSRVIVLANLLALFALLTAFSQAQQCLLPEPEADDRVSIASFNIRIFSTGSRNDAELALIVDRLEQFDLIAIQELRATSEKVCKKAPGTVRSPHAAGSVPVAVFNPSVRTCSAFHAS